MSRRFVSALPIAILAALLAACGGTSPSPTVTVVASNPAAICPPAASIQGATIEQTGYQTIIRQDIVFPADWKSPNQYDGLQAVTGLRDLMAHRLPIHANFYAQFPHFITGTWVTWGIAYPDGRLDLCAQSGQPTQPACPAGTCSFKIGWYNQVADGGTPWPLSSQDIDGIPHGLWYEHSSADALRGGPELVLVGFSPSEPGKALGYFMGAVTRNGLIGMPTV